MAGHICRICLESAICVMSVFAQWEGTEAEGTSFVAQIITECTSVQIIENDGLPENICQRCAEQLKQVEEFIKQARQSDRILRDRIRLEIPINDIEEENDGSIEDVTEIDAHSISDESHLDSREVHNSSSEDHDDDDEANESDWNESKAYISRKRTRKRASEPDTSLDVLEHFEVIDIDSDKRLCCACWKQFSSREELKVHCDESHRNDQSKPRIKKFSCQFCHSSYSSEIAVGAHVRKMATVRTVYECKTCGSRMLERQKCLQHLRIHLKKKPTRSKKEKLSLPELYAKFGRICCALGCTEIFDTESQLLTHAHTVHKVNKVEGGLTYNEGKPIECPICFKRFKQEDSLERHQRFKYNETSNICTLCGAKFPTLTSLTIHERSHTKEKPFECEICSKGFGDKQSLKRHYVKHTDDKPFVCSICGVSFKRKRAMQSHMIIHAPGELPFKCEVCEKRFRVKAKLLYHMRTHTGEKPYGCRYCTKSFADFSNRMRHEHSHTGEKPYKCSYCPMGFITKRFLLQHERNHTKSEKQASADIVH
ncbi:zinc finger protein OZF-like [Aedes albopictus]|uniref:C2h2-type zn-finger protein n=1 Tax=Aedes albopictus TaxID=7160 RepID=A0ABM1ZMF0_AEDAL